MASPPDCLPLDDFIDVLFQYGSCPTSESGGSLQRLSEKEDDTTCNRHCEVVYHRI